MVVTGGSSYGDGGESSGNAAALRSPSNGEKFPRAVAKMAVAQICESAGFHALQRSALETLTDIAIRYLCDVGKASQLYANLSGRTQSNALDAVAALEDMSGASFSDPHGLAMSSPCVKELSRFVEYADELPFPMPLIHFPACKARRLAPSFEQLEETPPEPHVPPWLPAFPDSRTYAAAGSENPNKGDDQMDSLEKARENQEAELSQIRYRFRFCASGASTSGDHLSPHHAHHTVSMGTSPPSASRLDQDLGKADSEGPHNKVKAGKRPSVSTQNPFLIPPLPEGSGDVSTWFFDKIKPPSPAPSTKKIIAPPLHSVRDAFRPVVEMAGDKAQGTFRSLSQAALPPWKDRKPILMSMSVGKNVALRRKDSKRECNDGDDDKEDDKKSLAKQRLLQYFSPISDDKDDDDAG